MEKFFLNYSLKNIPIGNIDLYMTHFYDMAAKFVNRMRWKAFWFSDDVDDGGINDNTLHRFPTRNSAPKSDHLKYFEEDLYDAIKKIKFRRYTSQFQNCLKKDISEIKKSKEVLVCADKTTNIYKVPVKEYNTLISKAINSEYKKAPANALEKVNNDAAVIIMDNNIKGKIPKYEQREAFITIKDHKNGFPTNVKTRLINPAKTHMGKVAKAILDEINCAIRAKTSLVQWKNTQEVITWFEEIPDKQVISMNAASQAAAGNNLVRVSGGTSPDTSPTKEMMSGGMWEPLFNTRRRHLLAREMSDLISCVDRHMHEDQSLDELAANNNEQNHLFSMHEKAVFNLIDRSPKQLCDFTKSHLTRVFPSEGRIDSTNFNAQDIWNSGAQIASLNYQTPGLIMDINDGRFSMNGGCGYVLKPKFMRDKLSYFSPFGEQPASLSRCLHLRIISGQNFPKPRGGGAKGNVIDPYVLIELFGVSVDCREDRTRTATNDNGVCPQFDESFEFRLAVPSLVLVRFVVLDDDFIGDEFIGQYTAPLECMRPGYRHLNLRSIYDEPLDRATLFVHIAYTDIDCPLLGSHLTTPMITSTGASSPTTMGRTTSFRRNGTATSSTVQRWSSRKKNNRNSQNGSLAREPDPISLRPVGLVAFDDAFGRLSSSLGKVAAIRDVVRMSLAFFRESCGLAAPTSIKRCIRSLYERSRPRHCPTSPSPTSCGDAAVQPSRDHVTSLPPLTIWREGNKRPHLQLIMRGSCAIGENWKKTQVAFDNLVNELTMAVEMAEPLDGVFAITLAKIAKLHEDFGQIYDSEYNRSPGHHSAASSSGGNVSAQSLPTAGGVEVAVTKNSSYGSERKKSGKKRRTVKDLMLDSERRVAIEETIKWNCSMIDATRQLCAHLTETSTKILRDLWQGAVMCGIGKQSDKSSQSTTTTPPHHHSSSNGSADGSTSS